MTLDDRKNARNLVKANVTQQPPQINNDRLNKKKSQNFILLENLSERNKQVQKRITDILNKTSQEDIKGRNYKNASSFDLYLNDISPPKQPQTIL